MFYMLQMIGKGTNVKIIGIQIRKYPIPFKEYMCIRNINCIHITVLMIIFLCVISNIN